VDDDTKVSHLLCGLQVFTIDAVVISGVVETELHNCTFLGVEDKQNHGQQHEFPMYSEKRVRILYGNCRVQTPLQII
jgi:hypothetical protein